MGRINSYFLKQIPNYFTAVPVFLLFKLTKCVKMKGGQILINTSLVIVILNSSWFVWYHFHVPRGLGLLRIEENANALGFIKSDDL